MQKALHWCKCTTSTMQAWPQIPVCQEPTAKLWQGPTAKNALLLWPRKSRILISVKCGLKCHKEIKNFNKREVWAQVPRETMGQGRKALHTRWIFKIKNDNFGNQLLKARLVVKGYGQVPGVDFTKTFSPVAGDTMICTVLATAMHLGWNCKAIDVEAAFLNADLEEDVFVEVPEGFETGGTVNWYNFCKLLKAVYGIFQAPRCWSKTFTRTMIDKGLEQSDADPCLFILRENENKDSPVIGLVVNYVDDGIIAGTNKVIELIKSKISSVFTISDLGPLKKHLGMNYTWKSDKVGEYWEVQMQKFWNDLISDYEKATGTKYVKV